MGAEANPGLSAKDGHGWSNHASHVSLKWWIEDHGNSVESMQKFKTEVLRPNIKTWIQERRREKPDYEVTYVLTDEGLVHESTGQTFKQKFIDNPRRYAEEYGFPVDEDHLSRLEAIDLFFKQKESVDSNSELVSIAGEGGLFRFVERWTIQKDETEKKIVMMESFDLAKVAGHDLSAQEAMHVLQTSLPLGKKVDHQNLVLISDKRKAQGARLLEKMVEVVTTQPGKTSWERKGVNIHQQPISQSFTSPENPSSSPLVRKEMKPRELLEKYGLQVQTSMLEETVRPIFSVHTEPQKSKTESTKVISTRELAQEKEQRKSVPTRFAEQTLRQETFLPKQREKRHEVTSKPTKSITLEAKARSLAPVSATEKPDTVKQTVRKNESLLKIALNEFRKEVQKVGVKTKKVILRLRESFTQFKIEVRTILRKKPKIDSDPSIVPNTKLPLSLKSERKNTARKKQVLSVLFRKVMLRRESLRKQNGQLTLRETPIRESNKVRINRRREGNTIIKVIFQEIQKDVKFVLIKTSRVNTKIIASQSREIKLRKEPDRRVALFFQKAKEKIRAKIKKQKFDLNKLPVITRVRELLSDKKKQQVQPDFPTNPAKMTRLQHGDKTLFNVRERMVILHRRVGLKFSEWRFAMRRKFEPALQSAFFLHNENVHPQKVPKRPNEVLVEWGRTLNPPSLKKETLMHGKSRILAHRETRNIVRLKFQRLMQRLRKLTVSFFQFSPRIDVRKDTQKAQLTTWLEIPAKTHSPVSRMNTPFVLQYEAPVSIVSKQFPGQAQLSQKRCGIIYHNWYLQKSGTVIVA